LNAVVCPSCQRPVTDADALFCAGCGAPLGPPTTIELPDTLPFDPPTPPQDQLTEPEPEPEPTPESEPVPTIATAIAPVMAPPPPVIEPPVVEPPVVGPPASPAEAAAIRFDNRMAAWFGIAGAAVTVIGAFQVWLRIRIADFVPPGSAETGWKGGDGRTIVVAAAVASVAAAGLFIGRRDLWLKVALLITGGVSIVIAAVNMVDAGSKAHDIEVQFGIPSGDVHAQVGIGLYLVTIGGLGLLASGLRARTTSS